MGGGEDSNVALIFPSQTQVATKRQQVISQFAHLSHFLEEQQSVLLAQLERLDGDILKQQEEFDSLATGEICRFSALIEELEEKNTRPARGLLTVRPSLPSPPPPPPRSLGSLPDGYLLHTCLCIPDGMWNSGPRGLIPVCASSRIPWSWCSLASVFFPAIYKMERNEAPKVK